MLIWLSAPSQLADTRSIAVQAVCSSSVGWSSLASLDDALLGLSCQTLNFEFTPIATNNPGLLSQAPAMDETGNLVFAVAKGQKGQTRFSVTIRDDGASRGFSGGVINGMPYFGREGFSEDFINPEAHEFSICVVAVNQQPNFSILQAVTAPSGTFRTPYLIVFAVNISAGEGDVGQALSWQFDYTNPDIFAEVPILTVEDAAGWSAAAASHTMLVGVMNVTLKTHLYDTSSEFSVYLVDDGPGDKRRGDRNISNEQRLRLTVTSPNFSPSFELFVTTLQLVEDSGEQFVENAIRNATAGPASESWQSLNFSLHKVTAEATSWPPASLFSSFSISSYHTPPVLSRRLHTDVTTQESESRCENTCAHLFFTVQADYNGDFTVSIMAKDNGGVAGDGVDSFVRSFAIEISSVNDAPSFRLLMSDVRMVQQRPPVAADDRVVLAQVVPAPLDERSQQLSFVVTFASSGCSANDFIALPLVHPNGTLIFRAAESTGWSCKLRLQLFDDGAASLSGVNFSEPLDFMLEVYYLNTPPAFVLTRTSITVVANDRPFHTFTTPDLLANMTTGVAGEAAQAITFAVRVAASGAGLFRYQPHVDILGTLRFEPFAGEHGSTKVYITARDDGGVRDGGKDTSREEALSIVVLPLPRISTIEPAIGAPHGRQKITIRGSFLSAFEMPGPGQASNGSLHAQCPSLSSDSASPGARVPLFYEIWQDWRQSESNSTAVSIGGQTCDNVTIRHAGELVCETPPLIVGTSPVVSVEVHVRESVIDSGRHRVLTRSARPPMSFVSFTYVSMYYGVDSAAYYGLDLPPFAHEISPEAATSPDPAADPAASATSSGDCSAGPIAAAQGSEPALGSTADADATLLSRREVARVSTTPIPAAPTFVRAVLPLKGTVLAMCTHGGRLFIGGSLQASSSLSYSKFVTSWDGRQEQPLGFGVDGPVRALLPLGPDLLVAGAFTRAYQPVHAGGAATMTGGAALWNAAAQEWRLLAGVPLAASVTVLARNQSTVYVAGSFRHGVPDGCVGLCALTLNRSRDTLGFEATGRSSWSPVGGGVTGGAIWTMSVVHGHGLIVGGSFASVVDTSHGQSKEDGQDAASGGQAGEASSTTDAPGQDSASGQAQLPYAHLALWNGYMWRSMGDVTHPVRATAMLGEHLYIGGDFFAVEDVPARYFARRHMVSGVWSALEALPALNGPVRAFSVVQSCIYLGGAFTRPSKYVTRYCLGRDQAFDAVAATARAGPVSVLAAASERAEAEELASLPKDLVCRLTSAWPRAPGCPEVSDTSPPSMPESEQEQPVRQLPPLATLDLNKDGSLDFDELVRHRTEEDEGQ